jgi:trans-aconitate methyltransferase
MTSGHITKEYQQQLKQLHSADIGWGNRVQIPKKIIEIVDQFNPCSILDYGCGKGHLTKSMQTRWSEKIITGWDPSTHTWDQLPDSTDFILSTDVLEHVEPAFIEQTLFDLSNRANDIMYHVIACYPAVAILPDGRNAHLIVEKPDWWRDKFKKLTNMEIVEEEVIDEMQHRAVGEMRITEYKVLLKKI